MLDFFGKPKERYQEVLEKRRLAEFQHEQERKKKLARITQHLSQEERLEFEIHKAQRAELARRNRQEVLDTFVKFARNQHVRNIVTSPSILDITQPHKRRSMLDVF